MMTKFEKSISIKISLCAALVTWMALWTAPAAAQDAGAPDGFRLGVFGAYSTNPYVGEGNQFQALPLVSYRKGRFSAGTLGLSYDLARTDRVTLTAGITPRFSGLYDSNAAELDGIERKITGDAFVELGYQLGNGFDVTGVLRQEVTGEHEGQELRLALGYGTQFGRTSMRFAAGAQWQSDALANYMWGIRSSEARVGRSAYDSGTVVIPYLLVEGRRPLSGKWDLVGSMRADLLPSEVSDSPIVDQDNLLTVGLGVAFQF